MQASFRAGQLPHALSLSATLENPGLAQKASALAARLRGSFQGYLSLAKLLGSKALESRFPPHKPKGARVAGVNDEWDAAPLQTLANCGSLAIPHTKIDLRPTTLPIDPRTIDHCGPRTDM
jgi:hypothetical protein